MILKRKWLNIFLYAICILCRKNQFLVSCFNSEGHDAIGMVAMSGLKGDQLYELKKLLNGKDLVDIGKWGHLVHNKIKEAESMHFNLQNHNCKNALFTCEDKNGLCLINSIKYIYNQLSSSPGSSTGNELNFKYPRNINFTDSDLLKYFVSLMSDMHQPLRLSFLNDNAGKNIKIIYYNEKLQKVRSNMFEYLENQIINKMIEKHKLSWYSGWTHINQIFESHKKDEDLFKKKGIDSIYIWANEIIYEFCSQFYINKNVSSYMIFKEKELYFNTDKELEITYDMEFALEMLIKNNFLKAGSRISIILNDIFEKKKFSNIRKRSSFDKVEYEELNAYNRSSLYKNNAILINLSIIFVVLLIIFYIIIILSKRHNKDLPSKIEEFELKGKCN